MDVWWNGWMYDGKKLQPTIGIVSKFAQTPLNFQMHLLLWL